MHHETALEWFHRSTTYRRRRRRQRQRPPGPWAEKGSSTQPSSPQEAAHQFVQGRSGLSYIDHVWRQYHHYPPDDDDDDHNDHHDDDDDQEQPSIPVIALEGTVATTWTLRSLAAHYVVATRSSACSNDRQNTGTATTATTTTTTAAAPTTTTQPHCLPHVLILDSTGDFIGRTQAAALRHVVHCTLLRQSKTTPTTTTTTTSSATSGTTTTTTTTSTMEADMEDCLRRIHVVDAMLYPPVALLEVLSPATTATATTTTTTTTTPTISTPTTTTTTTATLILWDGLPSDDPDIVRQWVRVASHTNKDMVWVVTTDKIGPLFAAWQAHHHTTTTTSTHPTRTTTRGTKRKIHRIGLQRQQRQQRHGKHCVATVLGKQFYFSLSLGGILS